MNCPHCGSVNESGKFCTKCGNALNNEETNQVVNEQAVATDTVHTNFNQNQNQQQQYQDPNQGQPQQPNEFVEKTKEVSKQYFSYFLSAIKQPSSFARTVNGGNMINGIITLVLLTLFISLTLYFSVSAIAKGLSGFGSFAKPSFGEAFLKPFFYIAIYFAFLLAAVFGVLKLSRVPASFQDVTARFGTYLVVPAAIFLVTMIATILSLGANIIGFLLMFGLLSVILGLILTFTSFKERVTGGLDSFFGVLIVFLAIFIVNKLLIDSALKDVMDVINPFGF